MKRSIVFFKAILWIFLLTLALNSFGQPNLTDQKQTLLKVVTAIHFTFQHCAKTIWPGYDLSSQSYMAYWPEGAGAI